MFDTIKQDLGNKLYEEKEFMKLFSVENNRNWCECKIIVTPTQNIWKIKYVDNKNDMVYYYWFEDMYLMIKKFEKIKSLIKGE